MKKNSPKTIRKRKSRKATGRWAQYVIDLRRQAYGVDPSGNAICTRVQLAEALMVSPVTLGRWELGKQDPPPKARAQLIYIAMVVRTGQDLPRAIIEEDYLQGCGWLLESDYPELHLLGPRIFDLARAGAANWSRSVSAQQQQLASEMLRLMKKEFDWCRDPAGMIASLKWVDEDTFPLTHTETYPDVLGEGRHRPRHTETYLPPEVIEAGLPRLGALYLEYLKMKRAGPKNSAAPKREVQSEGSGSSREE